MDLHAGPLLPLARVAFEITDAELQGFALAVTMCLPLALVAHLARRLAEHR
jgi:hypothetical protein